MSFVLFFHSGRKLLFFEYQGESKAQAHYVCLHIFLASWLFTDGYWKLSTLAAVMPAYDFIWLTWYLNANFSSSLVNRRLFQDFSHFLELDNNGILVTSISALHKNIISLICGINLISFWPLCWFSPLSCH